MSRVPENPAPSVLDRSIPGGWAEQEITVADRTFRLLLPARPNDFLEQLDSVDEATHETDPYWAELWPAASTMARSILQQPWPADTAIELGCGVGLVGLAALCAGLDVTFTDHVALAVATAVENARRNGFVNARGDLLDWWSPHGVRASWLFGSDLLYDRLLHAPLLATIDRLLAETGECWLGDPGRSTVEDFLVAAHARRLRIELRDEHGEITHTLTLGEFRLLVLRR